MAELQSDLQRSLLLLRTLLLSGGGVESPPVIRQTVEEVITLLQRNVTSGVPASDEIPCGRPAKGLCQHGPECWCGWDNVAKQCVADVCRCKATSGVPEVPHG